MSEKIKLIVEGGKASAGAQLGQTLGPLKINITDVLSKINEKTIDFKGMKVPVEIKINDDKSFEILIGTPPVSELIKKELGIKKGSGEPNKVKIDNVAIEQVIKIAKMKKDSMLANNMKSAVKNIVGSCASLGILIESDGAKEINEKIDSGKFDNEINNLKTEVSEEKKLKLNQELKVIQEEIAKEQEKLKAMEEVKEEEKKEGEEVKEEEKKEGEEVKEEVQKEKTEEKKKSEEKKK